MTFTDESASRGERVPWQQVMDAVYGMVAILVRGRIEDRVH
jgi:hypothetical protein